MSKVGTCFVASFPVVPLCFHPQLVVFAYEAFADAVFVVESWEPVLKQGEGHLTKPASGQGFEQVRAFC